MVELRISDKVCQLLGIVPTRICSKLIGSALVFGFGFIVGASVLVLTATIFMFSSFSSSGMNPLLQNDVNRYHHHHESSVLHCSSETPSPPPASPPTLSTPSMSPSFPPSPLPASPSPLPPPRASPSPLPSPPNNPSPSPLSPPLSFPETLENSTEENQTGRNSYYNSSDNLPEVKSVDAKVDLLNTIAPTFSSDTRNVSFGDDSESSDGDCDMYDGEWVRVVNREPYYSLGSCPFIEKQPFDCYSNGKRDNDYLNWQWQWNSTPTNTGCKNKTSIFDGTDFLMRLRGKKLVFSGDSINRNMYESLVCMLWSVVPDKSRIVTPSLYSEYKTRGDLSLIFEDYNCTVAFVWSPFLVNETNSKTRRRRRGELKPEPETLRLDQIDGFSSSVYQDADIVVFDSYHWWVQEKTNYGINYFQEGDYLYPKLDINRAYRRALMSWRRWIDNNIDSTKTQVVFRGFSLSHYGGGRWNTGGKCSLEAEPITSKEKYINPDQSQVTILEDTLQKMKTPVIYLNVSKLTYYRSDAHPSLYAKNYTAKERSEASLIQDCSHWCLPGVPDTWNELLYNSLLKAGKGSFGGR